MTTLTNLTPSNCMDWAVYRDDTKNEYHIYLNTESFLRESFNEMVTDNSDDYEGTEDEFRDYCLNDGGVWAESCLDAIDAEYDSTSTQFNGEVEHDYYFVVSGK